MPFLINRAFIFGRYHNYLKFIRIYSFICSFVQPTALSIYMYARHRTRFLRNNGEPGMWDPDSQRTDISSRDKQKNNAKIKWHNLKHDKGNGMLRKTLLRKCPKPGEWKETQQPLWELYLKEALLFPKPFVSYQTVFCSGLLNSTPSGHLWHSIHFNIAF